MINKKQEELQHKVSPSLQVRTSAQRIPRRVVLGLLVQPSFSDDKLSYRGVHMTDLRTLAQCWEVTAFPENANPQVSFKVSPCGEAAIVSPPHTIPTKQ